MGSFKKVIGQKIRERRKIMGFKTQESLAEAIDVDRTRVSRWESGQNLPDPDYKEALADALGVHYSFFEDASLSEPARSEIMILDRLAAIETKIDKKQAPDSSSQLEKLQLEDYERLKAFEQQIIDKAGPDVLKALQNLDRPTVLGLRLGLELPDQYESNSDERTPAEAGKASQHSPQKKRSGT